MASARAGFLVLGAGAILLGIAVLGGGGSGDSRLFPIGCGLAAAICIAAVALLGGRLPRPLLGAAALAFLGLFAAFVLWSGLSVQWSFDPDASWRYFDRDLVYLGFAVLGVLAGALAPRAPRALALGLLGVLALALGWALLGKVVPSLYPDYARQARLRSPVGYWNALALLGAIALVLATWVAACRSFRPSLRAAGAVVAYAAVVATVLTFSRGGIAVAVLALLAWLALGGRPFDSIAVLLLVLPASLGVSALALNLAGIADDGQPHSVRAHDGRIFGGVLVGVAVFVFVVGLLAARAEERRPLSHATARGVVAGAVVAAVGAVAVVLAVLVVHAGGPGPWFQDRWHEFANPQTTAITQSPSRLGSLSLNYRWSWWKEAWSSFTDRPLEGAGGGSFEVVNKLHRTNSVGVLQPHNVALQMLSDVGIVGFLLFAGTIAAGALAAAQSIRRLDGADRAAAVALAIAAGSYVVHSLGDFDWDFVAATAPAVFLAGATTALGVPVERGRAHPFWAAGTAAIVLAALASLAVIWVADRRYDSALAALSRRDYRAAARDADDAHTLDPLNVQPLLVWGLADTALGNPRAAYRRYQQAVDAQPKNADAWFALGAFELDHGQPALGRAHLAKAKALDPYGAGRDVDRLLNRR